MGGREGGRSHAEGEGRHQRERESGVVAVQEGISRRGKCADLDRVERGKGRS